MQQVLAQKMFRKTPIEAAEMMLSPWNQQYINSECLNFLMSSRSVTPAGGDTPILGQTRDVQPEWVSFPGQGVHLCPKICRWVMILTHRTFGLVTISIIILDNGWLSCKLNKTYCNSVKVWVIFYGKVCTISFERLEASP